MFAGGQGLDLIGEELSPGVLPEDRLPFAQNHPTVIVYFLIIATIANSPIGRSKSKLPLFQLPPPHQNMNLLWERRRKLNNYILLNWMNDIMKDCLKWWDRWGRMSNSIWGAGWMDQSCRTLMMGISSSSLQNRSSPLFLLHFRTIFRSPSTVRWGSELPSWNCTILVLASRSGCRISGVLLVCTINPEVVRSQDAHLNRPRGTSHRLQPSSTPSHGWSSELV